MKYEVTLIEVRSLSIEIESPDSDTAVRNAKISAKELSLFDKRLGIILVPDVKEIKDE